MKIEDFVNLSNNSKLKERVEQVISLNDVKKQYEMCQIILEYINAAFLTRNMNIKLKDYEIIRITENYREIDKDLFEQMVKINALYNTLDNEADLSEDDIEYLLFKIDKIYEIIRNKYGDLK